MLISVSHDTVVSNKHEERTKHYYVNFQHNFVSLPQLLMENIDVPLLIFPVTLLSVFSSVIFPFFSAISFTAPHISMTPS